MAICPVLLLGFNACAATSAASSQQPRLDTLPAESVEAAPARVAPTNAQATHRPPAKPEAKVLSTRDRLEQLLTKEPGVVDASTAGAHPDEVAVLRGICEQVVLSERGELGCRGCPECWNSETVEAAAVVMGDFLENVGDNALVVVHESGWNYRYFVLAKGDGRWQVKGTVVLNGLPVEHRRLRVRGRPDILVRKTVAAGAPGPTAVDAVRFARDEVQVTALMVDSRAFDACVPSDYALRKIKIHDVNSDGIEDVTLSVDDFSRSLLKPDTQQKAQRACAEQVPFQPPSGHENLVFTCDGEGFLPDKHAVKLLHLEEGPVDSDDLLWEVSASH